MGTIWVKEFTGGLDRRRVAEATTGGTLVVAKDGHISRGGEFEQRAAFVPEYSLPDGTVGLFASPAGLTVFGSDNLASSMPSGVKYQRLQHPTYPDDAYLVRLLSADTFKGKIYAVGEFSNGDVFHYYNGARVEQWYDGRAGASFRIIDGSALNLTWLKVNGVSLIGSTVVWTGDAISMAAAIAAAVNAYDSTPNYTATATDDVVNIIAPEGGDDYNLLMLSVGPTGGGLATPNHVYLTGGGASGGAKASAKFTISSVGSKGGTLTVLVNGDAICLQVSTVQQVTTTRFAEMVAAAINARSAAPDFTATSKSNVITVTTAYKTDEFNGVTMTFVASTIGVTGVTAFSGGLDDNTYTPGSFVRTVGSKVYCVSDTNLHFSGIAKPTRWDTTTTGAGFIDLSMHTSGSEALKSIARYQQYLVVFSERTIQVWYVDPDPTLNKISQVLSNTGTSAPHSVTAFGDTDIFYLDESGLRSLKARDSSNAASTADIGVPIDALVTEQLALLTEVDRDDIFGLIEPIDGRFWLIMKNRIFVFSYFAGAKVSAWSEYTPSRVTTTGGITDQESFDITGAAVYRRRAYVRSADTIYCYGGKATGGEHDETVAEAWLPYLDGNDPTRKKAFRGLDVCVRGTWAVAAAMNPNDQSAEDDVAVVAATTYPIGGRIDFSHEATHISLRFRSMGVGPHKLCSCIIHFDGGNDADG